MSSWSDPTVILAIIGTATALLYTILTGFIWHATWQNTRATREILEAAQRPYLAIASMEVVTPEFFGGEPKIAVKVSNVGTVPGRKLEMGTRIALDGAGDIEINANSVAALFQSQSFTASLSIPEEYQQLIGNGGFDVSVTIRYQGMTDKQYATYGTYKYKGLPNGFSVTSSHFE